MQIRKKTLAALDAVYAVCPIELDGQTHFLAATEGHGQCLLFAPPDWTVSEVWDKPGGTMSLIPIPKRQEAFFAIQEFFPIFKSENAGLVYATVGDDKTKPWKVQRVLDLPFIHRAEVVMAGNSPYVVAASLCGGKDFIDDWSKPGKVYVSPVPEGVNGKWKLTPVLEGISKNHGMHVTKALGEQAVLISGQEGLFSIHVPNSPDKSWKSERLLSHEISDMYVGDIDGDGQPEIITIESFHGNTLAVYKQFDLKWKKVCEAQMDFGHVVWTGKLFGKPAILAGNRGGEKELVVLRFGTRRRNMLESIVLDQGVGPTQAVVINKHDGDLIISANHGIGEVALYEVKN